MSHLLRFLRRIPGIRLLISEVDHLNGAVLALRSEVAELRKLVEREFVSCDDRDRDALILLSKSLLVETPTVNLETVHPIAAQSDDHKFPRGTRNDNTRHPRFVRACELALGKLLWHLDLGCAGGGLVWDFVVAGHNSFGIEGSDLSLKEQRAEWRTIPKRLFTADITRPFRLFGADGNTSWFDVITAWEVLEHIPEDSLHGFFDNVIRHLRPGGLFVGSIATSEDQDPTTGAVYHVTIRPQEWWTQRFAAHGLLHASGLFSHADFVRGSGNIRSAFDWDATTNPSLGFHVVLRRAGQ